MWTKEFFGTDLYHLIFAFIIYSILGWLVESIYMSWCNRNLTNRGFGRGPFCPIYGFGAVAGYLVLHPLSNNLVGLYFAGAILATIFEYIVGIMMQKLLGEVWWDYNEKPLNYKGIICLESTIAWGFYAIAVVTFLHGRVMNAIDYIDVTTGTRLCCVILVLVIIDYCFRLMNVFNIDVKEQRDKIVHIYRSFKARWY